MAAYAFGATLDAPEEPDVTDVAFVVDKGVDRFWDADWRREHKGGGRYPEHTLWELAWGVRDLEGASASAS